MFLLVAFGLLAAQARQKENDAGQQSRVPLRHRRLPAEASRPRRKFGGENLLNRASADWQALDQTGPKEITARSRHRGQRILTNAHVVLYAGQVQVQANQSGDKISARVEAVAPGIDLAVLKLDDESFFDTRPRCRAPHAAAAKDTSWPMVPHRGTSLSITKGIVSRIDYAFTVIGFRFAHQIDAAINAGNSGGPAVVDDKMIGLAYSRLVSAQTSVHHPCEEIELFLQDMPTASTTASLSVR